MSSNKSHKSELPRREYIGLLFRYTVDPKFEPSDARDCLLSKELIEDFYLSGEIVCFRADSAHPEAWLGTGRPPKITVKGRLFLQTLQREEAEASLSGRVKKHAEAGIGLAIGIIIGICVPVLSKVIQELFDLSKK